MTAGCCSCTVLIERKDVYTYSGFIIQGSREEENTTTTACDGNAEETLTFITGEALTHLKNLCSLFGSGPEVEGHLVCRRIIYRAVLNSPSGLNFDLSSSSASIKDNLPNFEQASLLRQVVEAYDFGWFCGECGWLLFTYHRLEANFQSRFALKQTFISCSRGNVLN